MEGTGNNKQNRLTCVSAEQPATRRRGATGPSRARRPAHPQERRGQDPRGRSRSGQSPRPRPNQRRKSRAAPRGQQRPKTENALRSGTRPPRHHPGAQEAATKHTGGHANADAGRYPTRSAAGPGRRRSPTPRPLCDLSTQNYVPALELRHPQHCRPRFPPGSSGTDTAEPRNDSGPQMRRFAPASGRRPH